VVRRARQTLASQVLNGASRQAEADANQSAKEEFADELDGT
jgi:hypothetical protein